MNSFLEALFRLPIWVVGPVFAVTWVAVGWTLKEAIFVWLRRLSQRTTTRLDDVLIAALNPPVMLAVFITCGAVFLKIILPHYSSADLGKFVLSATKIGTVVAIILFVDRLLQGMIDVYSGRV